MYVISSPNSELSVVDGNFRTAPDPGQLAPCGQALVSVSVVHAILSRSFFFFFPSIEISCDMYPLHYGCYFLRIKTIRPHLAPLRMQYFEHNSAKLGNLTTFYLEFLKITLNSNLFCTVSQTWTCVKNTGDSTDWMTASQADLSSFRLQEECHKFSAKHFLFPQCFETPDSAVAFFMDQVRGICEMNLVFFCYCRLKL
jgi:hypothetical protein